MVQDIIIERSVSAFSCPLRDGWQHVGSKLYVLLFSSPLNTLLQGCTFRQGISFTVHRTPHIRTRARAHTQVRP